ncbi:MAG: ABC transporter permease [Bacteroidia bacterium]|jgi:putative ABC transport system permease protein
MFDADRIDEIYQTLSRNKLRTTLTAFGVFWGILMLILMLGLGQGLQNGITQAFSGTATNSFFVWAQTTSMPFKGLPKDRSIEFRNGDIEAIKKFVSEAQVVAPANQLGGYRGENNVVRGTKTAPFTVRGDYPEARAIQTIRLTKGRFINYNDLKELRKVCVIGERVRQILFKPEENPLGEYLQVNGIYFQVVGTYTTDKGDEDAQEQLQTIYTPFTTFQQAFNYGDFVSWFSITSKPNVSASVAEAKVRALLASRHKIHPDDKRAIGSWNMEKEFKKIMGLFNGIRILVWIVGTGTLLAGVIGVSNIMLILVKERTKEIGIRRAIGASPISIMRQVMSESVALTLIAGYLGLVSGILLLEGIQMAIEGGTDMFRNPGVDLQIAFKALGILVGAGLLAGLIPARKAIAIKPVDALRAD